MTTVAASAPVLEARSLSRTFSVGASFWGARETLRAVDDVSLTCGVAASPRSSARAAAARARSLACSATSTRRQAARSCSRTRT